ncbi:MAG TPA: DUF86 domain-containing protein [Vicinamibacterales bacterium]|nr:DUF86 domain-containing protein [Vicinamibacterales bacterium]
MNRDLVARKIARARQWVADAEARVRQPRDVFLASIEARDLATFYIFLAVQEVIDLGAHWVADEGWGTPDDAGGTFDILASRGAIPVDLADGLRAAVGLRNRIAHGYATIDHERLHQEATAGISNLRDFLSRVASAAGL